MNDICETLHGARRDHVHWKILLRHTIQEEEEKHCWKEEIIERNFYIDFEWIYWGAAGGASEARRVPELRVSLADWKAPVALESFSGFFLSSDDVTNAHICFERRLGNIAA